MGNGVLKGLCLFAGAVILNVGCACAGGYEIYNILPCSLGAEERVAADAKEYVRQTGKDVVLYSMSFHPQGRPAQVKADRLIASFRRFQDLLKGSDVRVGVLLQSIFGHWPRVDRDIEPWQRTIDIDGKEVRFCPLDSRYREYIRHVATEIARCRPVFIMTDDDMRAFSHQAECFCPLHVAEFNRRRGTSYTADSLRGKIRTAGPGDADYEVFFALQREMVEGALAVVRSAVDEVDPTIPSSVCLGMEEIHLGVGLARSFAAKSQMPMFRPGVSLYCERMSIARFPVTVLTMLGVSERYRGSGIRILDEADTYPHNLWSKSSVSFMSHMVASAFAGFAGAKAWYVNAHKGAMPVSRNYTRIMTRRRGYLDALADAVEGTSMEGLAVPCFTNATRWRIASPHDQLFTVPNGWADVVASVFGIPFQVSRDFGSGRTFALSTALEVELLSDADIDRILAGRALVSGDAAVALSKRGKARFLGVEATPECQGFTLERDRSTGKTLNCSVSSKPARLHPIAEVETLSDFRFAAYSGASDEVIVAPSATLFRNGLGGTVVTCSYHLHMGESRQYDESRKAWLVRILDALEGGRIPYVVENDQHILALTRKGEESDLLLVFNLNFDPVETLRLRTMRRPTKVEVLSDNGSWRDACPRFVANGAVELDFRIDCYRDLVLRMR